MEPLFRMPAGGYAVRHDTQPGIYGFSPVSRGEAWKDALANSATGASLYGLTNLEETAAFGSWHVTLVGQDDEVSPVGSSPGISKLQAETPTVGLRLVYGSRRMRPKTSTLPQGMAEFLSR